MTLSQLRKELKAMGYKLKLTSVSWGRAATFHKADGKQRPTIYFTVDQREEWRELNQWLDTHYDEICELAKEELITGLR